MKIIREQQKPTSRQGLEYGWVVLALFAAIVAIFGGSSRTDVAQMVGLRPLAALFLIPALFYISRSKLAAIRSPALLLGLLCMWTAIQLVPLPAGMWQALPGRGPVAELGLQLGQGDIWRPISMVPTRTINALAGLVVPVTALLLFAAMGAPRKVLFAMLIALGAVNAGLGILQVIGGPQSPLFFYSITNFGSAVGLFSNHNHSAVLSAMALVTIAYFANHREFGINFQWQRTCLLGLFILILLVALVGGSRAGLLTTLLALGASAILFWARWRSDHARPKVGGSGFALSAPVALSLLVLGIVAMIAMFLAFDRIPALNRVTESTEFEDLRWSLFPVLREMVGTYWLTGAGFGSFEEVYHIHEPANLMFSSYVNQAHNDLAQLIIEGGLPSILILGAFVVWLVRSFQTLRMAGSGRTAPLVYWVAIFTIIIFASLFDYPLRAPLFQMVAVWLVAGFATEKMRRIAS